MDKRATVGRALTTFLAIGLVLITETVLLILFRKRTNEKFSAENFARAVVAQNPKVFERLAEM